MKTAPIRIAKSINQTNILSIDFVTCLHSSTRKSLCKSITVTVCRLLCSSSANICTTLEFTAFVCLPVLTIERVDLSEVFIHREDRPCWKRCSLGISGMVACRLLRLILILSHVSSLTSGADSSEDRWRRGCNARPELEPPAWQRVMSQPCRIPSNTITRWHSARW